MDPPAMRRIKVDH